MLATLLLISNSNLREVGRLSTDSVRRSPKLMSRHMPDLRRRVTGAYDEMSRVSKRSNRTKSGETEKRGPTCTTYGYSSRARS